MRPEHKDEKNSDELKKFDFIVSNPPFKMDFSSLLEALKVDKYDRFFAGLPGIPKKNKNSMAIYETFIQHILHSLKDNGKAAIVVPTGFTTTTTGIPNNIRKELIDNNWLTGVIHMPSNIFATTGTSVSIIFIDKAKDNDNVMLIDGSNLGKKIKFDEGQRTVLNEKETKKLISYFKEKIEEPEFSVLVRNSKLRDNKYSIQAGQYVELKEEILNFDIDERLGELKEDILQTFEKSKVISEKIKKNIKEGVF